MTRLTADLVHLVGHHPAGAELWISGPAVRTPDGRMHVGNVTKVPFRNGHLAVDVLATDTPGTDPEPNTWTYYLQVRWDGGSLPGFNAPITGDEVDLGHLQPADPDVAPQFRAPLDYAEARDQTLTARDQAQAAAASAGLSASTSQTAAETSTDAAVLAQAASAQAVPAAASATEAADTATSAAGAAAGSASAAQTARTAAETARNQAVPAAESATSSATAAAGSASAAQTARTGAETARDQAQAATFAGTSLGTVNLNTVTTPGVYRQHVATDATLERNYPAAPNGGAWSITVTTSSTGGGGIVQRAVRTWQHETRGEWMRSLGAPGGTWGPWRFVPSVRIDQTAGRAFYTWDHLNNRDQLVHADTGWRDVSGLLINGWTASTFAIRRVGYLVEVRVTGLNGAAATSATVMQTPSGFTGWNGVADPAFTAWVTSAKTWRVTPASNFLIAGLAAGDPAVNFAFTYTVPSAWPTALPGTPLGAIPNL